MLTLLELMNKELESLSISENEDYKDLKNFITSDKRCKYFLRNMLQDKTIDIPDESSPVYYISKGRASHSIINYLLGKVFSPFADIYTNIGEVVDTRERSLQERLWLMTALYHDIGYFREEITDSSFDYKKNYKYYLFTDSHGFETIKCIDDFSQKYPSNFAYSYEEILAYDKYDRNRRSKNRDNRLERVENIKQKKEVNKENAELLNHGIFGGAYLFDHLMRKISFTNDGNKNKHLVKACCLCISQHNIFKSDSDENDKKMREYSSLAKLEHESDFRITKDFPLLLFLSLVDTIECVKKFSRTCNNEKYLRTMTVLSSVRAEVTKEKILIDFSDLYRHIIEKEEEDNILITTFERYIKYSICTLNDWTSFKVRTVDEVKKTFEITI